VAKNKVRATRLNWDIEFLQDIISGNGFIITEPATFNLDDGKQKALYGARSILYGTSYEDETAFIERYRCKCGMFKGKMFEGEECPLCHNKVEFKDTNIEFTGWISLGDNYIINPYFYNRLCDCIGKTAVTEITESKRKVDKDGNMSIAILSEFDEKPKHPYVGMGVIEFRNRFEEVMGYFKIKKKKKAEEIDKIIEESSSVFCSHIPIYSTLLRPQSSTSDTYYYNSIDRQINPLFTLSENIKNCQEIDKLYILGRIQKRVNDLWDENFKLLNGKEGLIRGQILGGSLNYTSRNVIIPAPDLRDDEIDLSYHTFLELYKFKIIYYVIKMDDISLTKAYDIWRNSYKFDNRIYEIMQFIVKKEKPKILMNRNPTLNYYSMLLMSVRKVKKSIDDFTLSVPLSVLPGLNADFDGDILNIIGLMTDELVYAFRKFDPVTRMIISRDSGLLNEYFTLTKCQLIDLYYLCTI
jgi:DNA-directed RNA polymerase beta' subunit